MRFSLKSEKAMRISAIFVPYFQKTYLFQVLHHTLEIKPLICFLTPSEALRIKIRIENSNIMRFERNAFSEKNALYSNGIHRLIFGLRL